MFVKLMKVLGKFDKPKPAASAEPKRGPVLGLELPTFRSSTSASPPVVMTPPVSASLSIFPEPTPNPNSMKFVVIGREILPRGGLDFANAQSAGRSPLASRLFKIPEVAAVFLGTGFLTVTRKEGADWKLLIENLIGAVKDHLETGGAIVDLDSRSADQPTGKTGKNPEVEVRIREVLDTEIRPAVARDGGDIVFESYEDGVVTLHLRGSCTSCPSSILTLKAGVETRLKAKIPEVTEVISV